MTTPWPVKAASPCICTHMTLSPKLQSGSASLTRESCFALVFPNATGFTASELSELMANGQIYADNHLSEMDCEVMISESHSHRRKESERQL